MKPNSDPQHIHIPNPWTPEQATAVVEFLVALADAILTAHQDKIAALANREANGPYPQHWDGDCSVTDFLSPQIP